MASKDTEERLNALEDFVHRLSAECFGTEIGAPSLGDRVDRMESDVATLSRDAEMESSGTQALREEIVEMRAAATQNNETLEEMRMTIGELRAEVRLLKIATANGFGGRNGRGEESLVGRLPPRQKIPEPKSFGGERDARELQNYFFDMEQYFKAIELEDERQKVTTATMYLTGDAKVWWRTQWVMIEAGRLSVDTWDELKRCINKQYLPHNAGQQARRTFRTMRKTGSVRD